jgi:hypothetical protein
MNNIINAKTGPLRIIINGRYVEDFFFDCSFIISMDVLVDNSESISVSLLIRSSSAIGEIVEQFLQIDIADVNKSVVFNMIIGVIGLINELFLFEIIDGIFVRIGCD